MLHPETSVDAPIAQTTSPPEKKSSDPRAGAFWMIMSAVGVTLMMLSVRVLSADLPSQMIVCLRSLFGVSVLLPLLINGRLFRLRMASPRLHLLRGLCAVAALNLGFFAMSVLPLATATILFFLAPIFATAGAAVFLGEKVGIWRWGAVVAATIGALIVVRPGVAPFDLGTAAAIVSTVFFASQLILSKSMSQAGDDPNTIFATTILVAAIGSVPLALPVWSMPADLVAWTILAGVVAGSSLRMYSDIRAYAVADAGYLAPWSFLRLVFTGIAAWIAFGEALDLFDALGGTIIIGSTLLIAQRESRVRKRAQTTRSGAL